MPHDENATDPALDALHAELERAHVIPTWIYAPRIVGREPVAGYRPYLWRYAEMRALLMRAGELITPERGAERRSIDHVNPDLEAHNSTSHSLATAFQLVRPGECAPSHRHTAGAIRFAVESEGGDVFTAVEGEKLPMGRWDLCLTPRWKWHEHQNNTESDIVWLDALDYPLVNLLRGSFFEPGETLVGRTNRPEGFTERHVGRVRPAGWAPYPDDVPLVRYPWDETWAAIQAMRGETGSPYDGVLMEYVNPFTSGPALPTMACYAQLLRPNEHTKAHRQTASTIYHVMEGEGFSVIDGLRFDWAKGDVFVVPPWAAHEHANATGEDALLFAVSDRPVMDTFGFYREEPLDTEDGRQRVEGVFDPVAFEQGAEG